MGLGSFFRSIFSRKYSGRAVVETQIKIYNQQRNAFPDQSPHIHLAQTWLSRQNARGKDTNNELMQMTAMHETLLFACIPHPRCAEALGLYILYKEQPRIVSAFPEFSDAFNKLVVPVMELKEKGALEPLYRKYNPTISEDDIKELFKYRYIDNRIDNV